MSENADIKWYVVHTYSGYENKVRDSLLKAVENNGMQDKIVDVRIPIEEAIEIKNNKRRTVQRKLLPGYVMVKMEMTNETWYVVRNTRGVTGFVGPGSKPVPLTEQEIINMGIGAKAERVDIDLEVGDLVTVISGVWENTQGTIKTINEGKQTVIINIDLFGRETPVEIAFEEIKVAE